jgi:hypothetical protein
MTVIPALRRLKWEDQEFKANLDHTVKHCLKKLKSKLKN